MSIEIFQDPSLTAILDGVQDAVITHGLDFDIAYCNPAVHAVLGYNPDELVGENLLELFPHSLHSQLAAFLQQLKDGSRINHLRSVMLDASGAEVEIAVTISPMHNRFQQMVGASLIFRDISQELAAELVAERLSAIVEGSQDAIVGKTLEGVITSWNKGAETIFGYKAEEVIGKSITILIAEDRISEEAMILERVGRGEKIEHFETVRKKKSGEAIPVSLTISPIRSKSGKITGVSKIARDITGLKLADEHNARLAAIVESSDDAIISKTLEGIITSWNKGATDIFGYSEQNAVGQHISLIIPKERLHEEDLIISNIRSGNKIDHFHTMRKRKDGSLVPISLTVSPIRDRSGNIIGCSKIARDISDQKMISDALQQNVEKLQILNNLGKSISETLNLKEIVQRVTDAATQVTGASFGAFFYNITDDKGQSYMLYTLSGASREDFDKFGMMPRNTAVFHPTFSGEAVVRVDDIRKDPRYGKMPPYYGMPEGHLPVVSYLAVPVFNSNDEVIGGLFFGHPEPAVFKAEHEDLVISIASQAGIAIENSKLFEQVKDLSHKKDEFIALATHELKTPLTSLNGFLQLLAKRVSDDTMNTAFLEKCLNQLNKLQTLISDLFDVSKIHAGKMELRFEPFDFITLVGEVIEPLQEASGHKVNFQNNGPLLVTADHLRIEQVVTNLVSNAVKYSPDGGDIAVQVWGDDNLAHFSVADKGIGIANENLKDLFSQFYRAVDTGRNISGLGLGLFISKEIIERHGGTVSVESELGKGSVFTFSIPLND